MVPLPCLGQGGKEGLVSTFHSPAALHPQGLEGREGDYQQKIKGAFVLHQPTPWEMPLSVYLAAAWGEGLLTRLSSPSTPPAGAPQGESALLRWEQQNSAGQVRGVGRKEAEV